MTPAQKAAEQTGFYNAAKYLLQTYNGTGKTFIFRAMGRAIGRCRSGVTSRATKPSATNVQGMIDWINARQAGIDQARAELAGQTDVKVYGTLEVNKVADAINGDTNNGQPGWATVTNDVLPYTTVDFASYSSYDTQQITTGPTSYANAVQYIAQHLPPTAVNGQNTHSVYVGEYGLAEDSAGSALVATTMNNVISTVKADGMPYAFYWEIYSNELNTNGTAPANGNDSAVKGFYFIKPDGTPATAFHVYLNQIMNSDPSTANAAGITRAGVKLAYASKFTASGRDVRFGVDDEQLRRKYVRCGEWRAGADDGRREREQFSGGVGDVEYRRRRGARAESWGVSRIQSSARQSANGFVGIQAFGSNHGSASGSGNQPLDIFSLGAWKPFSINPTNAANVTYNWDTNATLGVRLGFGGRAFRCCQLLHGIFRQLRRVVGISDGEYHSRYGRLCSRSRTC